MDLSENFKDTGIDFVCDPMTAVDQESDEVVCQENRYHFDYLILATGARHAYEVLPGSREFAHSVCDPARILETREALLHFERGEFFAGAGFSTASISIMRFRGAAPRPQPAPRSGAPDE